MEVDPKLFSKLLEALDSLASKIPVGVPTTTKSGNTLILGASDVEEAKKAAIWGTTIQTGRFFPNDKNFGFLKPLFGGLKTLFNDVFINKLPGVLDSIFSKYVSSGLSGSINIGGGAIVGKLSGLQLSDIGDGVLKLATSLGLSAVGFTLFSMVTWIDVAKGIGAIGLLSATLVGISKFIEANVDAVDSILDISKSLGLAALGLAAFSLVSWSGIGIGMGYLISTLAILGLYSARVVATTEVAEDILTLSKSLSLAAIGFILFSAVDFTAAIGALGVLIGGVALLNKFSPDVLEVSKALLFAAASIGVSALGFMLFSLVDPESMIKGAGALAILVMTVAGLSAIKTNLVVGAGAILLVSASLIPIALAFNLLNGIDWTVAATAVGGVGALAIIAGIIGGFAPLAGFIALGAGVIALLGISLLPLASALKAFSEVNSTNLPQLGADMGAFLTNLNENITTSTLAFLPGIALALKGLGSSLLDFGKFIPLLITLPTSGLVFFGRVIGTFLDSLTENISFGTINSTRVLIPLLADISPVLTQLSESVQRFGEAQTSILPTKAADISNFFENLDISTGWFGDADNKITALKQFGEAIQSLKAPDQSFSEFINAFSSLGDVKINVDILSNETKKTNDILQTSVSIQTQQLNELKQQTSLLSKLQIPQNSGQSNTPQGFLSPTNGIQGVREQYGNSSYFIKSR